MSICRSGPESTMIFLLTLCAQHCFAMQQTIIDGNCLFFRDISVKECARYAITPPQNKKLILAENWLAMDQESQHRFHANTGIGHESYKPDWEPYLAIESSVPKICTFISGHHDMKDFCINDYFIASDATDSTKFDGVEFVSSGRCQYSDNVYTWIKVKNYNAESYSNFFVSIREDHHKGDGESTDYKPNLGQCAALALKYPYAAYCTQNKIQTNFLNIITRSSLYHGKAKMVTITPLIKKLSWLQGKNLLGLTDQGDILTIDVDKCTIYNQQFGNKKFLDIAVDMKHPWRFIALTEDFSVIYVDFSSHQATFKNILGLVDKVYNYVAAILNNAQISDDKSVISRSKNTYKTIMQLARAPESSIYKIWFHNDKIGVYLGENGNINGSFDIFKLQDCIFMLNMNKVDRSDSKCLEGTVLQLDCHT